MNKLTRQRQTVERQICCNASSPGKDKIVSVAARYFVRIRTMLPAPPNVKRRLARKKPTAA
jgi:hypothetical protein